ncbi:hypothetical protein BOX17_14785 [Halomonas aestuarii]|uniref:O-antigen ligase-related domain-containing protein n=1 Tax=Halomonas aestuarii TaxID=1897729 RepID=A0A1J0VJB2_9GAMM|nr:O-antigen ligase family protein [Halomonas aestuarii]APE32105.1 hypothetical protein BOX17_14785 [Halomonas aestuarii]
MAFFSRELALSINLWALTFVLAFLIATPVPIQAVVASIMLYAIAYLVAHRRTFAMSRLDWAVLVLLSLYALSRMPLFVLDGYAFRYLSPGLHMAGLIPVYLMLRHLLSPIDERQFRCFMEWGVVIGCVGALCIAVVQTQVQGAHRADGFLFSINFGYLSCAMTFLALSLLRGGLYPGWLLLAALAGAVACMLTLTRGAILAIPPLILLILALNADRLGKVRILGFVIAVAALALLSYVTMPSVERRVTHSISEFTHIAEGNVEAAVSSGGRLQLWTAATHAFMARPLVGLTYDERERLNAELVEEGVVTSWVLGVSRGHAHSQYFEMAASGGLLGLMGLFGYLVMPGLYHWRNYRADRDNIWSQVALVFTAGFILYSLTEAAIHKEMMATFYAYMQVVLLSLALCHRKDEKTL